MLQRRDQLAAIHHAVQSLPHDRVSVTGSAMRWLRGDAAAFRDVDLIVYEPPFAPSLFAGSVRWSAFSLQFAEPGVDLHYAGAHPPSGFRYQSEQYLPFEVAWAMHCWAATHTELDADSGLWLVTRRGVELAWHCFQTLHFPKFATYPRIELTAAEAAALVKACPAAETFIAESRARRSRLCL